MGKVLVIKGADFSENNVDVVPIYYNGTFYPNIDNYQEQKNKISAGTYTDPYWSAYAGSSKTNFYPIKKGQVVTVPAQDPTTACRFAFVKTIGGYDEQYDLMTGQLFAVPINYMVGQGQLLAPEDGFLAVTAYITGDAVFPTGMSVRPYNSISREITENTTPAAGDKTHYMKADGTYGTTTSPDGKYAAYFFNVFKGETLTIVANSSKNASYAFCEPVKANGEGQTLAKVLTGQSRTAITAGQSSTVTVPADGLLYILGYDGNNRQFPESITVTRATL